MDNSESTTQSPSRLRGLVVAVAVLLGSSLFVRSTSVIDPAAAGVVLAGVAAGLVWRRSRTATADDEHEDDDSDVWNAIPSWQYGGRHVESGGLARGEQERALQEIQEQADELSRDHES
ncbi:MULTISPECIES: hypothetical protein [Natronorubrum]|uniref:Uncharacterized protein n=2 Tax=Natronorubrum bangense TaxID=61858 RepID=L9WHL3_9EURY|nr:hypothetical protein [Natronorubrum bangense]ELY48929.1 hypothetical protein C494_09560 [Natronorubrum bangense JCM 10635]QCC54043.1 hypothetical protein DV706_05770 [Natronorubrum bangense]